jgi:prepilin-type N-terminal cleavage/methylation domain-containing protein
MLKWHTSRGFSLIEILVTITIVSLLATIGHAAFVSYTMRARIVEALKVLDEYQATVMSLRARNDNIAPYYVLFSDDDTSGYVSGTTTGTSAVKTVNLKYANTVSADTGTSGANTYILLGVGLQNDGVITSGADHIYLAGIVTPEGVITWHCGKSTSKANNLGDDYLPKTCLETLP